MKRKKGEDKEEGEWQGAEGKREGGGRVAGSWGVGEKREEGEWKWAEGRGRIEGRGRVEVKEGEREGEWKHKLQQHYLPHSVANVWLLTAQAPYDKSAEEKCFEQEVANRQSHFQNPGSATCSTKVRDSLAKLFTCSAAAGDQVNVYKDHCMGTDTCATSPGIYPPNNNNVQQRMWWVYQVSLSMLLLQARNTWLVRERGGGARTVFAGTCISHVPQNHPATWGLGGGRSRDADPHEGAGWQE